MDEADAASHQEDLARTAAMRRRHTTLPAIGRCYSCGADADAGRKFCDRECLEDFERVEAARRRGGRE